MRVGHREKQPNGASGPLGRFFVAVVLRSGLKSLHPIQICRFHLLAIQRGSPAHVTRRVLYSTADRELKVLGSSRSHRDGARRGTGCLAGRTDGGRHSTGTRGGGLPGKSIHLG